MNRLLFTAALLASFLPAAYAQDYAPKFDQGLDLKEFVQAATDPALQTCMPLPQVDFATVKTTLLVKELPKPKAGSYFGPLQPIVSGNKVHLYSQKYVPLLHSSPDPVAKELLIQWENIENARVLLLNEANALGGKDAKLYADGEKIAQDAAALNKEIEAWKAETAAYNKQCAGQPVNTNCTNWYNKLVAWQEDLKKRIAAHNAAYAAWKERAQALTDSVNGWKGRVRTWEQAILYFIEKAQAFLHDTGNCTPTQHENLQKPVHAFCDLPRACKQWHPNNPTEDCAAWREFYQRNIDCHNARREINQVCYDGGNPTHQEKENEALVTAGDCWALIEKNCLKTMATQIPGRRYGGVLQPGSTLR